MRITVARAVAAQYANVTAVVSPKCYPRIRLRQKTDVGGQERGAREQN